MEKIQVVENERGSVLVIALIMLVLLTILGISATTTSDIEVQIAGNERNYKRTFYTANSGIEHVKASLSNALTTNQAIQIATDPTKLNWTFALDGSTRTAFTPSELYLDLPFAPLSGYAYQVCIYDDTGATGEDADPAIDKNGIIFAEVHATGPNGAVVFLKVQLLATASGQSLDSYSQYGGDMSKNFHGNDLNAMSSFAKQM
jgi:type IV pilus assembly protein PilX